MTFIPEKTTVNQKRYVLHLCLEDRETNSVLEEESLEMDLCCNALDLFLEIKSNID